MKKIIILILIIVLPLSLVACNSNSDVEVTPEPSEVVTPTPTATPEPTPTPEPKVKELVGTYEEILRKLHDSVEELDSDNMFFTEVTEDKLEYYFGTTIDGFVSGMAAEPMMNVQPHSIVLVQVEEDADIEAIKADIKANANGFKWICVGVEDENILVENIGHTVVLIMDANAKTLREAFLALETE